METNSQKILEALPNYNDILNLIQELKGLSLVKMELDTKIKEGEALAFKTVMSDAKFFINSKPMSSAHFDNAYKFSGINGELLTLRHALLNTVAEFEAKKAQLDLYRQMQEMYKTIVYAERAIV